MSNAHQETSSKIQRVRRWFASPDAFAAAAAGRGDPSLLLTLGSYPREEPPAPQGAQRPDAWSAANRRTPGLPIIGEPAAGKA